MSEGITHGDVGVTLTYAEYHGVTAHTIVGGNSFPGAPTTKDFYYRDDLHKWFQYRNTAWIAMGGGDGGGGSNIPAASGSKEVTHGLGYTPDLNDIIITPKDDFGGRSFWVSEANGTTFSVYFDSVDPFAAHNFAWKIISG